MKKLTSVEIIEKVKEGYGYKTCTSHTPGSRSDGLLVCVEDDVYFVADPESDEGKEIERMLEEEALQLAFDIVEEWTREATPAEKAYMLLSHDYKVKIWNLGWHFHDFTCVKCLEVAACPFAFHLGSVGGYCFTELTCAGCSQVDKCPCAFDSYNTDGDCLMVK